TVGTFGRLGRRLRPAVASTFSLPAERSCEDVEYVSYLSCTTPARRSVSAGAAPLYATCATLTSAERSSTSIVTCGSVPMPAEEELSLPGFAFAYVIKPRS